MRFYSFSPIFGFSYSHLGRVITIQTPIGAFVFSSSKVKPAFIIKLDLFALKLTYIKGNDAGTGSCKIIDLFQIIFGKRKLVVSPLGGRQSYTCGDSIVSIGQVVKWDEYSRLPFLFNRKKRNEAYYILPNGEKSANFYFPLIPHADIVEEINDVIGMFSKDFKGSPHEPE